MTSTTYTHKHADDLLARLIRAAKSFGEKFVEVRKAQAERFVNAHLASLDDATLARIGVDRKALEKAPKAFYADF